MCTPLLNTVLTAIHPLVQDWIEPITGEQIELKSLALGRLKIRHLQIKQRVIDFIPLPVDLAFSYIGCIEIHIPVWNLIASKILIKIDRVVLIVKSQRPEYWAKDEFRESFFSGKAAALVSHEVRAMVDSIENGLLWKLGMQAGRNIRIEVTNVHVCFEDSLTRPETPFSIGIMLKRLLILPNDNPTTTPIPIPEDVPKARSLLDYSINVEGFRLYIDEERAEILSPELHLQEIHSLPIPDPQLINHPEVVWQCLPQKLDEENNNELFNGDSDIAKDETEPKSRGWVNSLRSSWIGQLFGGSQPEKKQVKFQTTVDDQNFRHRESEDSVSDNKSDGSKEWQPGELTESKKVTSYSARSTTDWEGSENGDQSELEKFGMDGRVSFSEIVKKCCYLMIYNEEKQEWTDVSLTEEFEDNNERTRTAGGKRNQLSTVGDDDKNKGIANESFITKFINEKVASLAKEKSQDAKQEAESVSFASSPLKRRKNKRHGAAAPTDKARRKMVPSLRVAQESLAAFNEILTTTFTALHDFIIPSTDLSVEVKIAASPIRVKQPPKSLLFSNFVKDPVCPLNQNNCLPATQLDVTLTSLKVVITDMQIACLLKWLDYHGTLYGTFRVGLISQYELARATPVEEECYKKYWGEKLLKGPAIEMEKVEWCRRFEKQYPQSLTLQLRQDVLNKIQTFRRRLKLPAKELCNWNWKERMQQSGEDGLLLHPTNASTIFAEAAQDAIREWIDGSAENMKQLEQLSKIRPFDFEQNVQVNVTLFDFQCGISCQPTCTGNSHVESFVVAVQCIQLSLAAYKNQTMRMDVEVFPVSLLFVTSPKYTRFIRSSEITDENSAFIQDRLHRPKKKVQHLLCTLSPAVSYLETCDGTPVEIGVPGNVHESATTAEMANFFTQAFQSETKNALSEPSLRRKILKACGPALRVSLALSTIRIPLLPDIWLMMRMGGPLTFVASPHLLADAVQGLIPLLKTLTRRDIDILYVLASMSPLSSAARFSQLAKGHPVSHPSLDIDIAIEAPITITIPRSKLATLDCLGWSVYIERIYLETMIEPRADNVNVDYNDISVLSSSRRKVDTFKLSLESFQICRVPELSKLLSTLQVYLGHPSVVVLSTVQAFISKRTETAQHTNYEYPPYLSSAKFSKLGSYIVHPVTLPNTRAQFSHPPYEKGDIAFHTDLRLPSLRVDILESDIVVWEHVAVEMMAKFSKLQPAVANARLEAMRNSVLIEAVMEKTQRCLGRLGQQIDMMDMWNAVDVFLHISFNVLLEEEVDVFEVFLPLPSFNATLHQYIQDNGRENNYLENDEFSNLLPYSTRLSNYYDRHFNIREFKELSEIDDTETSTETPSSPSPICRNLFQDFNDVWNIRETTATHETSPLPIPESNQNRLATRFVIHCIIEPIILQLFVADTNGFYEQKTKQCKRKEIRSLKASIKDYSATRASPVSFLSIQEIELESVKGYHATDHHLRLLKFELGVIRGVAFAASSGEIEARIELSSVELFETLGITPSTFGRVLYFCRNEVPDHLKTEPAPHSIDKNTFSDKCFDESGNISRCPFFDNHFHQNGSNMSESPTTSAPVLIDYSGNISKQSNSHFMWATVSSVRVVLSWEVLDEITKLVFSVKEQLIPLPESISCPTDTRNFEKNDLETGVKEKYLSMVMDSRQQKEDLKFEEELNKKFLPSRLPDAEGNNGNNIHFARESTSALHFRFNIDSAEVIIPCGPVWMPQRGDTCDPSDKSCGDEADDTINFTFTPRSTISNRDQSNVSMHNTYQVPESFNRCCDRVSGLEAVLSQTPPCLTLHAAFQVDLTCTRYRAVPKYGFDIYSVLDGLPDDTDIAWNYRERSDVSHEHAAQDGIFLQDDSTILHEDSLEQTATLADKAKKIYQLNPIDGIKHSSRPSKAHNSKRYRNVFRLLNSAPPVVSIWLPSMWHASVGLTQAYLLIGRLAEPFKALPSKELQEAFICPFRINISVSAALHSLQNLCERLCGISEVDAAYLRRSLGIHGDATYPEGYTARVKVDPIVLNIDSYSGACLIMLNSIFSGFVDKIGERLEKAQREQSERLSSRLSVKRRCTNTTMFKKNSSYSIQCGESGSCKEEVTEEIDSNSESSSSEKNDGSDDDNDLDCKVDSATATALLLPNENGWLEGNTEDLTISAALLNLSQFINVTIEVEIELFRLQLWHSADHLERLCCFSFSIEDIKLNGGVSAINQIEPWGWSCKLKKDGQPNDNSLSEGLPWWTKFNEAENIFGASNFSNLSLASYSFSHLDNSPFKVKPPELHQIFIGIKKIIRQLIKDRSNSKEDGDIDSGFLLGDVRRVLWRIRHATPWLVLKGAVRVHASFLNRSEQTKESLVEPVELQFVCAKSRLETPLQISCSTTWVNVGLNVAVLDICLVFFFGIIQKLDALWNRFCIKEIESHLSEREAAGDNNGCESVGGFSKKNLKNCLSKQTRLIISADSRKRQSAELHCLLKEKRFAWEAWSLPMCEYKERTLDRFDSVRAIASTLKIGLFRDNVGPSERYLNPTGSLPGDLPTKRFALDEKLLNSTEHELLPIGSTMFPPKSLLYLKDLKRVNSGEKEKIEPLLKHTCTIVNLLGQIISVYIPSGSSKTPSGRWWLLEHNQRMPIPSGETIAVADIKVRLLLAGSIYELDSTHFSLKKESFRIIRLRVNRKEERVCSQLSKDQNELRSVLSILARTTQRGMKSSHRISTLFLSSTLILRNLSRFRLNIFPAFWGPQVTDSVLSNTNELHSIASQETSVESSQVEQELMLETDILPFLLPPEAIRNAMLNEGDQDSIKERSKAIHGVEKETSISTRRSRVGKSRRTQNLMLIVDPKEVKTPIIMNDETLDQMPINGVHLLYIEAESQDTYPVPLYWTLFKNRILFAELSRADKNFGTIRNLINHTVKKTVDQKVTRPLLKSSTLNMLLSFPLNENIRELQNHPLVTPNKLILETEDGENSSDKCSLVASAILLVPKSQHGNCLDRATEICIDAPWEIINRTPHDLVLTVAPQNRRSMIHHVDTSKEVPSGGYKNTIVGKITSKGITQIEHIASRSGLFSKNRNGVIASNNSPTLESNMDLQNCIILRAGDNYKLDDVEESFRLSVKEFSSIYQSDPIILSHENDNVPSDTHTIKTINFERINDDSNISHPERQFPSDMNPLSETTEKTIPATELRSQNSSQLQLLSSSRINPFHMEVSFQDKYKWDITSDVCAKYSISDTEDEPKTEKTEDPVQLKLQGEFSLRLGGKSSVVGNGGIKRLPCKTLARSLTVFAEAWIVNRLDYSIYLGSRSSLVRVNASQRAMVSSEIAKGDLHLASPPEGKLDIPFADHYPKLPEEAKMIQRFRGTSNTFELSDLSTVDIIIPKSHVTPQLRLVASMARAPTPFLRTTVIEIAPAFIVVNDRSIPLWFREEPVESMLGIKRIISVPYFKIESKQRLEFHPESTRKSVKLQITGLSDVEKYFHKVLKPIIQKSTVLRVNLAGWKRDTHLWSQAFQVKNPGILQLRHPSSSQSENHIGEYSTTEIEMTIQNGIHFIRFLDPGVPDFRLVNISSVALGISQHKLEGPFEVLPPRSHIQLLAVCAFKDPSSIRRLEELSIPFSFYSHKQHKKLGTWLATTPPSTYTEFPRSVEEGTKRGSRKRSNDENKDKEQFDNAIQSVMVARKRVREAAKRKVKDHVQLDTAEVSILMDERECENNRKNDSVVLISPEERRRQEKALHFWGALKDQFARYIDLEAQFKMLKQRKLQGRPSAVLLLPLPHPHIEGAILPVSVALEVVSGSKWVIFSDFKGSDFHQIIAQHGVMMKSPADLTTATQNYTATTAHSTKTPQTVVARLYIKAQYDVNAIAELTFFVKYNPAGLDELASIWQDGSRSTRRVLRESIRRECGVDIKELNKLKNRSNHDAVNEFHSPVGMKRLPTMVVVEGSKRLTSTVPKSSSLEDSRRQLDGVSNQERIDDAIIIEEVHTEETLQSLQKASSTGDTSNTAAPWNSAINISLHVCGAGVGFNSSKPAEVIYASMSRVAIVANLKREEAKFRVSIGWLQVDDPSSTANFPTVVRPITEAFVVRKSNTNVASTDVTPSTLAEHDASIRSPAAKRIQRKEACWDETRIPRWFHTNSLQASLRQFGVSDEFEMFRLTTELKIRLPEESDRGLVDFPMIAVQLSPLSLSIDIELVKSLLLLCDEFFSCFDADQFIRDQHEVVQAENDPQSDAWKKLQGPAIAILDADLNTNGKSNSISISKIFIKSLEIGTLTFVINIRNRHQKQELPEADHMDPSPTKGSPYLDRKVNRCGRSTTRERKWYAYSASMLGEEFLLSHDQSDDDPPQAELIRSILAKLPYVTSISDAHISLSSRRDRDLCGTADQLVKTIGRLYTTPVAKQLHKVLGAFDIIGNPSMFLRHLFYGCWNGLEVRNYRKNQINVVVYNLNFIHWELSLGCAHCVRTVEFGDRTQLLKDFSKISLRAIAKCSTAISCGFLAGILDFISRCSGSWFTILNRLSRTTGKLKNIDILMTWYKLLTDRYSLLSDLVIRKEGQTSQPTNCLEGIWAGVTRCCINVGVTSANFVYKPIKASRYHYHKAPSPKVRQNKQLTSITHFGDGLKGCCLGCGSALVGSLGYLSSILLCGQLTAAGALHHICNVSFLRVVRPRRIFFGYSGERLDSYVPSLSISALLSVHSRVKAESNPSGALLLSDWNVPDQLEMGQPWAEWSRRQMAASRYPRLELIRDRYKKWKTECWSAPGWVSSQRHTNPSTRKQEISNSVISGNSATNQLRMLVLGPAKIGFLEGKSLAWVVSIKSIVAVDVVKIKFPKDHLVFDPSRNDHRRHVPHSTTYKPAKRSSMVPGNKTILQFQRPRRVPKTTSRGRLLHIRKRNKKKQKQQIMMNKRNTRHRTDAFSVFLRIRTYSKVAAKRFHPDSEDVHDDLQYPAGERALSHGNANDNSSKYVYTAEVCSEKTALLLFDFLSQLIFDDIKKF